MKVTVVGAGAFGFAIAHRLSENPENQVKVWSESQRKVDEYLEKGCIERVLGGHKLPEDLEITTSMSDALKDADLVFILCIAELVENVCEQMLPYLDAKTKVAIGSKGACLNGKLPPHIAKEILGKEVSMFAGPGFAIDIIDDVPVGFTFATLDDDSYQIALDAFSHDPSLILDRSYDVGGVSLCSCIKNAAALACGALYGHGHPISTQCLLMQRALVDLTGMIQQMDGGVFGTSMSLSGIGDLILTCFSPKSRNGSFGRLVGEFGFSSPEATNYIANNTVEGMSVVAAWPKIEQQLGIKSDFMAVVCRAFSEGGGIEDILNYINRSDIA